MAKYMLLLHEDKSNWQGLSAEDMQKAIEKYMAWSQKPFNIGGERLTEDMGRVMRATPGQTPRVTDGPYSETKEVLGGFYLIEAASYDEAVARAMDHPHLEYGGTIEVRETWPE